VLLGLLALGEPLPTHRGKRLLLLASWAAVAAGVSSMAGSSGQPSDGSSGPGHQSASSSRVVRALQQRGWALVKAALLLLPRSVRRRLPRSVIQWLGRGAHVPGGLGIGVYLRQVVWGSSSSGSGSSGLPGGAAAAAAAAGVVDRAAVDEVLRGLWGDTPAAAQWGAGGGDDGGGGALQVVAHSTDAMQIVGGGHASPLVATPATPTAPPPRADFGQVLVGQGGRRL
jgi:hypothetical protein